MLPHHYTRALLLIFGFALAGCGSRSDTQQPAGNPGAKVLASPTVSEEGPAANDQWLAWMVEGVANNPPPRIRGAVFVRNQASGRVRRVNPPGTYAETGSVDGSRLTFQLIRDGRSIVATANLLTGEVTTLPAYVNSGGWLWRPSASGTHLVFGEIDEAFRRYSIVVADLQARTRRVVASTAGHGAYAAPGQINGNWVTWTLCPDNNCNVYRLNLRTGVQSAAPNPAAPVLDQQYGPSVARDGTAYFGRTLTGCETQIMRWRGGPRAEVVAKLAANTEFQYSYVATQRGHPTLYYDLFRCNRHPLADIYALRIGR